MLYAIQPFINDTLFEECAPLATFESACNVVKYEFEQCVVNHAAFTSMLEREKRTSMALSRLVPSGGGVVNSHLLIDSVT